MAMRFQNCVSEQAAQVALALLNEVQILERWAEIVLAIAHGDCAVERPDLDERHVPANFIRMNPILRRQHIDQRERPA
jgi:hypothetical protein